MFNLIKYELKGKRLTILGICLTVVIGNFFLMMQSNSWGAGVSILSAILGGGALVVMLISSLTLMSDYLYNDQGYLLFTLPQSGVSIMISRLVTAVILISIVTIVSLLMFSLNDPQGIVKSILRNVKTYEWFYYILSYLWTIVSALTLIYFCMVAGKIALKGKMVGKIGSFIIFILLSTIRSGIAFIISGFFPQIMSIDSAAVITINIGNNIVDIITFTALLMGTAYLLEHKVDL